MKRSLQLMHDHENRSALYHCVFRTVWREFLFQKEEKEYLSGLIRQYEIYCGVRVLTYCVMSNHFHILVEVPPKSEAESVADWHDEAFLNKLSEIYSDVHVADVRRLIEAARVTNCKDRESLEKIEQIVRGIKLRYTKRMGDLSEFIKAIKQKFTLWYNKRKGLQGTLWEGRFKSQLVEDGEAALAVAAYIDLNPVRAGIVDDPKDYRWCGYGEAIAGQKQAQRGLLRVMQKKEADIVNSTLSTLWKEVMNRYRMTLAVEGVSSVKASQSDASNASDKASSIPVQGERKSKQYKKRHGFSRDEIEKVLAEGGKLSLQQMLRCKVRYFTDGVVIGSKAYVNEYYQKLKSRAQSEEDYEHQYEKRETGARKLRGTSLENLHTMRDLRKNVFM